jgi:acyl carrier protein
LDVSSEIRAFVIESFLYGAEDAGLSEETSLLGAGYVDSTGVLEIIGFLEKTFDITVEDEEMVPANLDSIAKMTAYVGRKRGEGA